MIALSWTVFALLTLFWTAAVWITAEATAWMAQALATGTAAQAARDLAAIPLPEWLKYWIDPGWLQPLQSFLQWALDGAGAGLPLVGAATGWLVPAIWIAWGVGLLLLMLGAAGAHMLVRRIAGSRAAHRFSV